MITAVCQYCGNSYQGAGACPQCKAPEDIAQGRKRVRPPADGTPVQIGETKTYKPTFDDGSGFGARSLPWFLAGAPGVFVFGAIIASAIVDGGDAAGMFELVECAVIPGLWSLLTWGHAFSLLSLGAPRQYRTGPTAYQATPGETWGYSEIWRGYCSAEDAAKYDAEHNEQ